MIIEPKHHPERICDISKPCVTLIKEIIEKPKNADPMINKNVKNIKSKMKIILN